MENQNLLTKWVIDKIKTEYRDDIALLIAVRGHTTDNDGHGEVFDYFIPETERGHQLAQTFIIDGVGHDLYPRSWERMEQSAELEEMTLVLSNAEILYAASEQAAERFRALQEKLEENLKDPVFVYRKALERLDSAMDIYRTLAFEEKSYRARSMAGYIHLYLSQAVAYLNHTYTDSPIFSEKQAYLCSPENRMYHCPDLSLVPESFFEYASMLLVTGNTEEIKRIVHALIRNVKRFVLERKPADDRAIAADKPCPPTDWQKLADWYQELSLTWRRIHFFCQNNMAEEAYIDAFNLQDELLVIAQEFRIEELNLLDSFSPDSLIYLDLRSQKLEQVIRGILAEKGIAVNEYPSLDEFLVANG